MTSAQQMALLTGSGCDVVFDNLTRQLYATDASIYQIQPAAVAFPRNTRQASGIILAAAEAGLSITPRGAGTGLVGGAIGDGVVVDFARHNREISDLDLARGTVRVGPGVVLDQLNAFLRPYGYMFGPDVATSSRATLGGMIANNSSGAHTTVYGTTSDHVVELEIVLADGTVVQVGAGHDTLRKQRELVQDLTYFHALEMQERLPTGLYKRLPGYNIQKAASDPNNLNHILCGSEGTLAAITSAELRVVRLPDEKGLALVFFDSVLEAMKATVALQELRPAAVEHIDYVLLDQTRGQREFRAARHLLDLDNHPTASILAVEFFGPDVEDKLAAVARMSLGRRTQMLQTAAQATLVWNMRKAGLSLLTGRKGPAKPVTCIEDTAVRPSQLPDYVQALQDIMARLELEASYYGHAAAGLLHVRPVLDLRSREDLQKLRKLSDEVSALVRQFKGSLAGEHGVGIARTEYMREQLGANLVEVMHQIKASFDPHALFNPGKILPDGRYTIDGDLRAFERYELNSGYSPVIAFAAKDGSLLANLEQCNGCGGCLKAAPSMCPTYQATGEEWLSTRGRSNAIRAGLSLRGLPEMDPLLTNELGQALESCLACKACTNECPSNVNMSLIKAELQHARLKKHGLRWREWLISHVDVLGALGCRLPRVANLFLGSLLVSTALHKLLGFAWQRKLPAYATQRFDTWFKRHALKAGHRGKVILWDDTFVRYHEPHIGKAAVEVLEAAGYEVTLLEGRKCCGRPSFSQGDLDRARKLGEHNLKLLSETPADCPIIFLEPSCWSMFAQDYTELRLEGAEAIASRSFLFEHFVEELLGREPDALHFSTKSCRVLIHAHCHTKALTNPQFIPRLLRRLPGRNVTLLDTGCCGMAGGFGMVASKYELSLKVAEPLATQLRGQPYGTVVLASGTSCRHQIDHLAPVRSKHVAEVLAEALAG